MLKTKTYQYVLVCVSMVAITLFNVSIEVWDSVWLSDASWVISGVYAVLSSCGVPLLITSIGSIVLCNSMTYSIRYVYTYYLPKAFLGCVLWWTAIGLVYMKDEYPNDLDLDTFFECLSVVLDAPYNVAFLQLVVSVVVFYPLLKGIADSPTLTKYICITSYVVTSLLPTLELIPYISNITLFTSQINWSFFTPFGTFLFLGVYLSRSSFEPYQRVVIYCLGVLSLVAMFTCTVFISSTEIGFNHTLVGYSSPFLVPIVTAVFVSSNYVFFRYKSNTILDGIERLSRCAYVFIPCVVISKGIINCLMDVETLLIAVAIPIQTVFTLGIALLLSMCLKNLPIVKYFTM